MMRKTLLAIACFMAIAVLESCYPNRFDDADDYTTVTTLFNETKDFGAYQTFALADARGIIEIPEDDTDVTHAYDNQFFARIRSNMAARGYTEVEDPNDADLVIFAAVTTTDYMVSSCYYWWDYYCWYYCYPGYGWCYPAYVTTYTTGTVVTIMIDRADADADPANVPVMWVASFGSILAGEGAEVVAKVDDAFAQSPYISAN
jgi:hypothetical protein